MGAESEEPGLAPGTKFGRYEIVRQLGVGGMGAVYEALHLDLKKRVAIKTMLPSIANDGASRARFLREGEAAARIRHPHVVDVSDIGTHDGIPYMVMEFLEGESLADLLDREGKLPLLRLVEIMLPVLAAVHAAHLAGIVHRDLKPDNIYLAKAGRAGAVHPVVLDFGISKVEGSAVAANMTRTQAVMGTAYYMSPEQAKNSKNVDPRCDQYSLGVILFEASTGQRPIVGETLVEIVHKLITASYPSPRSLNPELPEAFEAAVLKAMKVEPSERFSTVLGLGLELLPLAGERARSLWTETFLGDVGAVTMRASVTAPNPILTAPPETVPPAHAEEPATPAETKLGGAISAKKLFPTQQNGKPKLDTTLGASAGEVGMQPAAPSGPPKRTVGLALGAVVLVSGLVGLAMRASGGSARQAPAPPPAAVDAPRAARERFHVRMRVEPATAQLRLDGERVGDGFLERDFDRDGTEHHLRAEAQGYEPREVPFRDAPPEEILRLQPIAAAPMASPVAVHVPRPPASPPPSGRPNRANAAPSGAPVANVANAPAAAPTPAPTPAVATSPPPPPPPPPRVAPPPPQSGGPLPNI